MFGLVCVAGAVNLLVQRHPINSALSLIVVMGSLAVEYLLLGAEFVAAVQVIVYAGAIMVLFVFVIMLLNAGEEERTKGSRVAMLLRNSRDADWQRADGLGSDRTLRTRMLSRLARSAGSSAEPSRNFCSTISSALRSHFGSGPDRHHGRGRAGEPSGSASQSRKKEG